jgi:hypothetical protein
MDASGKSAKVKHHAREAHLQSKDYLRPLGLDTNHGFSKVAVENSEVAKRRTRLEQRLARLKQWAQSAGKREVQASRRREWLRKTFASRSDARLLRVTASHQHAEHMSEECGAGFGLFKALPPALEFLFCEQASDQRVVLDPLREDDIAEQCVHQR